MSESDAVKDIVSQRKSLMKSAEPQRVVDFLQAKLGRDKTIDIIDWSVPGGAGASSGVVLFTAQVDSEPRKFVLRFDAGEGFFRTPNIEHEYQALSRLQNFGVLAPEVYYLDESGEYLGTVGMLMEQVEGTAAEMAIFQKGALAEASPSQRERMVYSVVDTLAKLHSISLDDHDFSFLESRGAGSTPLERDIDWTWEQLVWARPDVQPIMSVYRDWLLEHQPTLTHPKICHGDANLTNVIFKDYKLSALLDWELVHLGAPEMDLAYLLVTTEIYQLGQERAPGCPSEAAIIERYSNAVGKSLDSWNYYSALAAFRVAAWVFMSMRELNEEQRRDRASYSDFFIQRLDQLTH